MQQNIINFIMIKHLSIFTIASYSFKSYFEQCIIFLINHDIIYT